MYDAYKPLRNHLRLFPVVTALQQVWMLGQHLDHGRPLPAALLPPVKRFGPGEDLRGFIFPWDLDVLSREIVINAGVAGIRSLDSFEAVRTAVQHLRRLENVATQEFFAHGGDVIREMHRIIHRQFPWQRPPNQLSLMRYRRIYGRPKIAALVEAEFGMNLNRLHQLTFAVCGHFLRNPGMSTNQDYRVLGIDRAASDRFFARFAATLPELRATTVAHQHYDARWLYAWNPLHATPLIRVDPAHPDRVVCPLPSLLMRRLSEGLFYDLASNPGFGDAFGRSFQTYVGEVLAFACPANRFTLTAEAEYWVGKNRKDGVDWILEDADAVLFIECKASRLRLDAKISADTAALEAGLDNLGAAIVQNYKNIDDALAGRTPWRPCGKPLYPLIVTLEDWWIFGSVVYGLLEASVRRQLTAAGLDPALVERMPYTVASVAEAEGAFHAIAEVGVQKFMREKTDGEHRGWAVSPFSSHAYPDATRKAAEMHLDETWAALVPEGG